MNTLRVLIGLIIVSNAKATKTCKYQNINHEYFIEANTGCITPNPEWTGKFESSIKTVCIGMQASDITYCNGQKGFASSAPSNTPSVMRSEQPSNRPSNGPSKGPTMLPTLRPTNVPTLNPIKPTTNPSTSPSTMPSDVPSELPSSYPTYIITETICT